MSQLMESGSPELTGTPDAEQPDVADRIILVYDEMRRLLGQALNASLEASFPSKEWDAEARRCLRAADETLPPDVEGGPPCPA